jgi:hypothetical protein
VTVGFSSSIVFHGFNLLVSRLLEWEVLMERKSGIFETVSKLSMSCYEQGEFRKS